MVILRTMKVLAYVHTYNSAGVIDATVAALSRQTYPVPEILLVDNASSDGTADRAFPDNVTLIRNSRNLGASGAVAIGMEYALKHGYDWIYILDADSIAEPDALEKLIESYLSLTPVLQASLWRLSSLPTDARNGFHHHGGVFTPRGIKMLSPPEQPSLYQCDAQIWSGGLFRLEAVRAVGLPNPNYVMDWGDLIYSYEAMIRGFREYVDQRSIVRHSMHVTRGSGLLSRIRHVYSSSPLRAYYYWRNTTYFWLYRYRQPRYFLSMALHFFRFCLWLIRLVMFQRPLGPSLRASVRGLWEGVHGRLDGRY